MEDFECNCEYIDIIYTEGLINKEQRGIALRCNDVGYNSLTPNQQYHMDKSIFSALASAKVQEAIDAGNYNTLLSMTLENPHNVDFP